MSSSKRKRDVFSVADIRQQVDDEFSFQRHLEQFKNFPADNVGDLDVEGLDAWIVAKFGLATTIELVSFARSTISLPAVQRKRLLMKSFPSVDAKYCLLVETVAMRNLAECEKSTDRGSSSCLLVPPMSTCLICPTAPLLSVQHECSVVVHGFSGAKQATKISTRCQACRVIYNYTNYGNVSSGWKLYASPRDYVEASDLCFVERRMNELQCSLANHCWVSFSGWSVVYNEVLAQSSTSCVLSDKNAAAVFWNGELETELRESGHLDYFQLYHKNEDREVIMEEIERRRSESIYIHSSQDCSDDCKKRGCGKLWVADGLWKIMFSHCAMSTKNIVKGLPLLNYPDVCTAQPQHGKAFCKDHCQFLSMNHPEVPTDIRGFLRHCGVLKSSQSDGVSSLPVTCDTEFDKVNSIVNSLADEQSSSMGMSVIQSQGNASFLTSTQTEPNTLLDDCIETQPTTCNKDTGEKKRLQKWSRGHFFIVRGSGIIDKWNPLFRSESPSQAFLFLIEWMLAVLKDIPECQWGDIFIAYDNMCHVDGMKVAQKALPFSTPYDQMWLKVNKVIDSLHIANHKSEECKKKYNPEKVKEKLPDGNTMAGEQTFTWLSRFKRILCSMPKVHHMFFLHRMVVRRNAYTVSCYKDGKKPVLPKARNELKH